MPEAPASSRQGALFSRRGLLAITFLCTLVLLLGGVATLKRRSAAAAGLARKPKKHAAAALRHEALGPPYDELKPLFLAMGAPIPGDWLYEHSEPGQPVAEYLASNPRRPTPERRTLYLQPIGDFDETQQRLIDDTLRWTEAFFGLPTKLLPPIPLSAVPEEARRVHPSWGVKQLDARFLLNDLLLPRIPADAMAYLGLTTVDLFPEPSWNFVFGMASYRQGVGVWSIARFGDPSESEEAYRDTLMSTAATATHEIFHMFSVSHCVAWECLENGSNSLDESEGRPIHLCPSCLKKLCWSTDCELTARFERMEQLSKQLGFTFEARYYRKALIKLGAAPPDSLPPYVPPDPEPEPAAPPAPAEEAAP
ncbi:MAG: archaemetzincin [Deltaproteobacteria bacterium]|nr:archaemetzincin [Deltaproteobacteria bacterium]